MYVCTCVCRCVCLCVYREVLKGFYVNRIREKLLKFLHVGNVVLGIFSYNNQIRLREVFL